MGPALSPSSIRYPTARPRDKGPRVGANTSFGGRPDIRHGHAVSRPTPGSRVRPPDEASQGGRYPTPRAPVRDRHLPRVSWPVSGGVLWPPRALNDVPASRQGGQNDEDTCRGDNVGGVGGRGGDAGSHGIRCLGTGRTRVVGLAAGGVRRRLPY